MQVQTGGGKVAESSSSGRAKKKKCRKKNEVTWWNEREASKEGSVLRLFTKGGAKEGGILQVWRVSGGVEERKRSDFGERGGHNYKRNVDRQHQEGKRNSELQRLGGHSHIRKNNKARRLLNRRKEVISLFEERG